jgi:hypothetical protein
VIGGVEPRAFKHNPHRLEDLLQGLLGTFWAAGERRIAKFLLLVELHAATGAAISIDGHTAPQITEIQTINNIVL